jgi:UDP-N-acetylglucosamine transferase subunit ALG13
MLLQKGANVTVAASGQPLSFLKQQFPEIDFVKSKGLNVLYPEKGSMALKMALSVPGFLAEIYREHRWLDKIIAEYSIDGVISDNRFGFWSNRVPCVYITHQVLIRMPKGLRFMEPIVHYAHGRFINKYDECWIPDLEGDMNLSGDLAHKYSQPANVYYIGPLTRFSDYRESETAVNLRDKNDLLIMLSGPEPQRSLLEKILRKEIRKQAGVKVAMLQGVPENKGYEEENNGLKVYSHLPDYRIVSLIQNARVIVCRSGYSTIMDLATLGKSAVLIPTPGQTEQEYLGNMLAKRNWFHCIPQHGLSLKKILAAAERSTEKMPELPDQKLLNSRIDHFLDLIKQKRSEEKG